MSARIDKNTMLWRSRMKCNTCGNVFQGKLRACPNCFGRDTKPSKEDETWANRYASEPMTKEEAEEYFDADKY